MNGHFVDLWIDMHLQNITGVGEDDCAHDGELYTINVELPQTRGKLQRGLHQFLAPAHRLAQRPVQDHTLSEEQRVLIRQRPEYIKVGL